MSNVGARAPKDKAAERRKHRESTSLAHADRIERASVLGRPDYPRGKLRFPLDDVEEQTELTADMAEAVEE